MKINKIITITVLVLVGLSLLACMLSPFIDSPKSIAFGTTVGLIGLTSLAALSAYWSSTMIKLNTVIEKLAQCNPENIELDSKSMLAPLLEAVVKFSEESSVKEKQLIKQSSEFHLKVQLLEKEKKNAEAILYSINDVVVVGDAMDRIILVNSAAESLFELTSEDVYLQPISEAISDANFVESMKRTREGKMLHVKQEFSLCSDPRARVFDAITSCVNDEAGNITGVVAVLHDITKEKEVSQMKNDFVSHVSHELKTPLASINAYAEMLVDGEAEDQDTVNEFCTIIQGQAQRLNRLIEEILNISRIESGLIKVNKEPISLAMQIKDASSMIESYAKEKNITVETQTPIIFDQVNADKDMISQVIINFLSNAVKYTQDGGTISVQSEVNEADEIVRLTVTDSGVGIPPEDVEHVFDKFYRVEANKKYAKGTGLGLNLVQQIIEKVHDGKVFVTSTVGKGSTFGFELPLAAKTTVKV